MPASVSVIVPTYRLGGMDCLRWSLDHQDYAGQLELVLVDALYEKRQEAVRRYFAGRKYGVVHLPPARLDGEPPWGFRDACPRYRNTGIQAASGDRLLFWSDFTLALPWVIRLHVQTADWLQRPAVVCGTHLYCRIIKDMLVLGVVYGQEEIDRYEADLAVMPKDDPRFVSIFSIPPAAIFAAAGQRADIAADDLDYKLRLPTGTIITPNAAHWKNESLPRAAASVIAGFDEYYNDAHCYDDLDFSWRLAKALKVPFYLDKGIEVLIPNPRTVTPILRRARSHTQMRDEWPARAQAIEAGETMPRRSILLLGRT